MSDDLATLRFVKDLPVPKPDGRYRTFWAPPCAGLDYTEACNLGAELALEALRHLRTHDDAPLLGWAVLDMPPDPDEAQKGTMVGFLQVFAEMATAAATPERVAARERRVAEWRAYWRQLVAEEAGRERDAGQRA